MIANIKGFIKDFPLKVRFEIYISESKKMGIKERMQFWKEVYANDKELVAFQRGDKIATPIKPESKHYPGCTVQLTLDGRKVQRKV